MGSAAVKRIEDVRLLRAAQFPEDAGPLAHPVRPDSYIEISNFYTATVYNKGAELIRMMHTMLGAGAVPRRQRPLFRAPRRPGGDLRGFRLRDGGGERRRPHRTSGSGTARPGRRKVKARLAREGGTARVTLEQEVPPTPGQPDKQPMPIPLRLALFGAETGAKHAERLVLLDERAARSS